MSDPISERILSAVQTQLGTVKKSAGYKTDAGFNVYRSRRSLDKFPCFDLWEGEETVTKQMDAKTASQMSLTFTIEAFAKADQENTGKILGLLKADIKRCVMGWYARGDALDPEAPAEKKNKGLCSIAYVGSTPIQRDDGSTTEGVSVRFTATYPEALR